MADIYDVTGQQQTTRLEQNGQVTQIMQVHIRTKPSQVNLTIEVPLALYGPENVHRLASEASRNAEQVSGL